MQKILDKEAEQALAKVLRALLIAPHNRHDHQWISKTDLLAVTGEARNGLQVLPLRGEGHSGVDGSFLVAFKRGVSLALFFYGCTWCRS